MNWFRQNRFLGSFLVGSALATLLSLCFLFYAKGRAHEAHARFEATVNEMTRLRRGTPFPNAENLSRTQTQTEAYRASLLALEEELQARMYPQLPLQPNEFQAQLRLAVNSVSERAAATRVQLPANFALGFDPYTVSLPNREAAARLGRQLRAVEWLVNTLIDAHVDALIGLRRTALPEEKEAPTPPPRPTRAPAAAQTVKPAPEKMVDSSSIELAFSTSPAGARRFLNQVAAAKDQFYVIRNLTIKNQADKGPKRGGLEAAATPSVAGAMPGRSKEPLIRFIVGTEHLDVAARIEITRFHFAEREVR
jgi:hypothetical protein